MNDRVIEILKSKFCQIETGESIYRYDLIVCGLGLPLHLHDSMMIVKERLMRKMSSSS